jgi:hypothetical protein
MHHGCSLIIGKLQIHQYMRDSEEDAAILEWSMLDDRQCHYGDYARDSSLRAL